MRIFTSSYLLTLIVLTVYSFGFVDSNFPYKIGFSSFFYNHRDFATLIYVLLVTILFAFYIALLKKVKQNTISPKQIWTLIAFSVGILFLSFPAFSYDIFNYIATAKVSFLYRENPYIVMPIEITNEPMLSFMHAANKIALYGPLWIAITYILHLLGFGNVLLTTYTFKFFIASFYMGLVYLLWKVSKKNLWTLAFFSLNPLVLVQTLISAHNDVVMMFFAVFTFYLLSKKKIFLSVIIFLASILIKYATVFLIPVYIYALYATVLKKEPNWKKIWYISSISMFLVFLLSPIREELYEWYFIWPLTFIALIGKQSFLSIVALSFSFGLSFRFAPFIYSMSWDGQTPLIKKIVSFAPPIIGGIFYALKKKI